MFSVKMIMSKDKRKHLSPRKIPQFGILRFDKHLVTQFQAILVIPFTVNGSLSILRLTSCKRDRTM